MNWNMAAANNQIKQAVGAYPTASGSTTQGLNGNTISVACVNDDTANGVPTVDQGECAGVKARINQANTAKTLPYKINVVSTQDTGSNAQTQTTDLTEAISNEKVFAMFVDAATPLSPNPMETSHIPYFGDFANCGKQSVFGFDISYDSLACAAIYSESNNQWTAYSNAIMSAYVKPKHISTSKVRYAAIGTSDPTIITYQKVLIAQYTASGIKVVYSGNSLPPSSGQAVNLNPYVVPVINAKPNAIGILAADPELIARTAGALKASGAKGNQIIAAFTSAQLQNPATAQDIDGGLATAQGWGFPAYGGKYWATLSAGAKSVGASVPVTQAFLHGWLAADQFVQGMQSFGATKQKLTTENFTNYLNNGWEYPGFGNVAAPTIYPFGKYQAAPCATLAVMNAAKKTETPYADLSCGQQFINKLG